MNQTTPEPVVNPSRSVFQSPLVIGLVAITIMTGAIIAFGSSMLPQNAINSISAGQIEDLDRFSSVIHFGNAEITGPGARERLEIQVNSSSFDSLMKRGLFGANAQRLDLYSIIGEPLYSTSGRPPVLRGPTLTVFNDAVNNRPSSLLMEPDAAISRLGIEANLLQTYKLIWDQPPGNGRSARTLMVAAITTNVGRELGVAHRNVWLIAGVFNAGMVLVLLVLHWASARAQGRLEQANQALAVQNIAVRESRERMVHTADSTKRAIAEELHGTVQSKLFAVWMHLLQFKEGLPELAPEQSDELDKITTDVDNIREEDIRGISHRLHPSIVRVGASAGLRSLRNFYESMVPVELNMNEAVAALEPAGTSVIPDNLRLGIYRVAELALGNVAKHSKATQCTVDWVYDEIDQVLVMTVTDNGVGFDLSEIQEAGLGMVNIADYADAMNAKLEINSRPGLGAQLKLTIPFILPAPEEGLVKVNENAIGEPGEQASPA